MNNGPEVHRFACAYVRNSNSRIRFNVFIGDPAFESEQHPTRYTFSVFCWSFLTMPSHRTRSHTRLASSNARTKKVCRRNERIEMGESHCSYMRASEFGWGFICVKYLLHSKYDDMLKFISPFKTFIFYINCKQYMNDKTHRPGRTHRLWLRSTTCVLTVLMLIMYICAGFIVNEIKLTSWMMDGGYEIESNCPPTCSCTSAVTTRNHKSS